MKFKDQVEYWAHMLDESYGIEDELPKYTGRLDGYKWLYCNESTIKINQFIRSFDSEVELMNAVKKDFNNIQRDGWTDCCQDPNTGDIFDTAAEAYDFFKKSKNIIFTDGFSFEESWSCIRIAASKMPKLIEMIYGKSNYDFSTKFDGNNIEADGLREFDDWDGINDMRA